ncbi:RICIN domain-containing protein [Micromonospora sp. BRA006-A]|uniref:RICIN domain-containing protein n=1 Tax=Micromonospora TaxID=1873 RepID=UPI000F40BD83|nr:MULTISPECIES: RICIN domain-containing protein [Micromonospora]MDW3845669.1 RICIN domain-containing protein [Micromonospora sp. BRA006-A]MEE3919509.1 RICIN domain-containing protein [Micromonospora sp. BRA006-A]RNH98177.1 hypothetical protein EEZ25_27445 [Micromonospora aurantiaca]
MKLSSTLRRATVAAVTLTAGITTVLGVSAPAQAATFTQLKNNSTNLALAPAGLVSGSVVIQRKLNSGDLQQQWNDKVGSDGLHTFVLRSQIKNGTKLVSGCLDLPTDVLAPQQQSGAKVVVRPCDGTNSQKWKRFDVNGSPAFNLENRLSQMSLDVSGRTEFTAAIQNSTFELTQDFVKSGLAFG